MLSSSVSSRCAHCGLPAPAGEAPVFCCDGCATVYAALSSCGLSDYYALRRELADAERTRGAIAPADPHRYAWLDDDARLAEHGFTPGEVVLRLTGLHCAACVWLLERLPRALPGVLRARVDYGKATLSLRWDPQAIALSHIAAFVHDLGYPVRLVASEAEDLSRKQARAQLWRIGVTGALAGNTMMAAFALYAGELSGMDGSFERLFSWLGLGFALPVVTWGAWPFHRGALAGLRMRSFHMDLPISIGIAAGFIASAWNTVTGHGEVYFDTVAILVFLLLLGRRLQTWGQQRAQTRGELMATLLPAMAERAEAGGWSAVRSDKLVPGDRVRVATDARVPADGEVVAGRSHVDVALLTGESVPEAIAPGAGVFAGAINMGPAFELEVRKVGDGTRLGQVLARACDDDARQADVVRLADRIAGWFVLAVLGLAAAGGAVWWWLAPAHAFDVVVALLVVSCPCALGLATPMALSIARSRAGHQGLILRSAAALEPLARVHRVVIDKTGTLTEGRLRIVTHDVPETMRASVAALARRSRHPVARALAAWADASDAATIEDFEEVPGAGMQARCDGVIVRIGSAAWLGGGERPLVSAALAAAQTPVLVERDGVIVGGFAIADRIRDEAPELLARMRALGLEVALRSGDEPQVVAAVAARLGIADARGRCSPEDKAKDVGLAPSIMIGDGINDAPALRAASVGIAVRGGAEAALAVADAYVARGDLRDVATLLEGARATMTVVRRNLGFSLLYNLVFASLALAGMVTPLLAAILMPLSSLTVIGSSMVGGIARPGRPATATAPVARPRTA